MSRDILKINKNLIPYTFNIDLAGENFIFRIDYNCIGEFFTAGLSKGETVLCSGEPIIYGTPLFKDIYIAGLFPAVDIVPISPSGEYNDITYANLSETVLLMIDDGETSILED